MIKAVLFDMDGVLIDTERINTRLTVETAKEFGFDVDPNDVLSMRSSTPEAYAAFYRKKYGDDFDYFTIRMERRKKINSFIEENGIPVKPGVVELLDCLKSKGIKRAVVTSTEYSRAFHYMEITGLKEKFDMIISASLVERGKPEPDVYLYAAEQIGEKPEDCIAVEDSHNGAISAFKAGCNLIVVPDMTPADEEMKQMARMVLNSLDELIPIIDMF